MALYKCFYLLTYLFAYLFTYLPCCVSGLMRD